MTYYDRILVQLQTAVCRPYGGRVRWLCFDLVMLFGVAEVILWSSFLHYVLFPINYEGKAHWINLLIFSVRSLLLIRRRIFSRCCSVIGFFHNKTQSKMTVLCCETNVTRTVHFVPEAWDLRVFVYEPCSVLCYRYENSILGYTNDDLERVKVLLLRQQWSDAPVIVHFQFTPYLIQMSKWLKAAEV
jgi:hypothetical protein